MNYIEVQKMRKQAADAFNTAVEKERQRRLAISKGDPRVEAAFDNAARQRAVTAQANRLADKQMRDQFNAEQKARTKARVNRVNAEIARQQKADAVNRAKAMGVAPAPKAEPQPTTVGTQPAHMGRPTTGTGTMKDAQGNVWSIQNGKQTLVSRAQQPRLAPKPQTQTNAYNTARSADIRAAAAKVGLKPGQVTRVGYDANGRVNRINGIGL